MAKFVEMDEKTTVAAQMEQQACRGAGALCLITPAAIGPQYTRQASEVINAAAGGPPDGVKIAEIMCRHGLRPAPHASHVVPEDAAND